MMSSSTATTTRRTRPRPNPTHRSANANTNENNPLRTNHHTTTNETPAIHAPMDDNMIDHERKEKTNQQQQQQQDRTKSLRTLDFPETVETIADKAYYNCWSLRKLRIPPTVYSIGASAFANCWELRSIELPEHIESSSSTTNHNPFGDWDRLWLKLALCFHEDTSVAIQDAAFSLCHSLRNVALPQSSSVPATAFVGCAELKKHFPHEEDLMKALKRRFDGLPVHKICYYQSHYPLETTVRNLEQAMAVERQKRHASHICRDGCGGVFGRNHKLLQQSWLATTQSPLETIDPLQDLESQQDVFGMTPLHILACSVHQSLDLYNMLIEYNPAYLVAKDKWGDYPLVYAYQTHAPFEVVILLLRSQKKHFPDTKLEWVSMVKKMCVNHASLESIQMIFRSYEVIIAEQDTSEREKDENLINLKLVIQDRFWFWKLVSFEVLQLLVQYQEANFPNDVIQWDPLVERLTASPHWLKDLSMDKIVFLLEKGTANRLARLGLDDWRQEVTTKINSADRSSQHQTFAEKRSFVKSVLAQLKQFELREMAALLELAIWKKELKDAEEEEEEDNIQRDNHSEEEENIQQDHDTCSVDWRQECLVSCGAEIVIANALPLISKSPSKLVAQRRHRAVCRTRRRQRRIASYVMNEI